MNQTSIKCPNCGASINIQNQKCEYCSSEIIIKSFNTISNISEDKINKYIETYRAISIEYPEFHNFNTSIGICFLKLKKYDEALESFKKAQIENINDATPFFYAAIAKLKGRKPFTCSKTEINTIEIDINAALNIDPQAIYYYFLSYVGRDYFKRKFLKHQPSCNELLEQAINKGLKLDDINKFHAIIGIPIDISL